MLLLINNIFLLLLLGYKLLLLKVEFINKRIKGCFVVIYANYSLLSYTLSLPSLQRQLPVVTEKIVSCELLTVVSGQQQDEY